jgi:MFS family permease
MVGWAVAPPTLLVMQGMWGWRGAFIGASLIGLAVAAMLMAIRDGSAVAAAPRAKPGEDKTGLRLLLSAPILLNLVFFVLLAVMSGGIYNYSVVALGALHGTPVTAANAALTGYLALSALGVLAGGFLVGRTARHGTVTTLSLIGIALFAALIAQVDLGLLGLIAAMTAGGFFFGVMMPARDMIVREMTPPGSFGKVFGFVTTGFNIGGIVSPLIFGALMDHGSPRLVFLTVAACALIAITTVLAARRRPG